VALKRSQFSLFPLIISQLCAATVVTAALVLDYCWLIFVFMPFSQAVIFYKF